MKLSGLTKMVKRQLVCNVFHNDESDDFYIGTASAIYCATGFPRPLNRNQMGAMLGISEDTMIEKVVYNDFDCAYKIDFQGFNLDDTIKDEVEVKKLGIGILPFAFCCGSSRRGRVDGIGSLYGAARQGIRRGSNRVHIAAVCTFQSKPGMVDPVLYKIGAAGVCHFPAQLLDDVTLVNDFAGGLDRG